VESLTRTMRSEAMNYFERIEELGGMLAAIDAGFFRREIADAAFAYQRDVDSRRKLIVGINAFQESAEHDLELDAHDPGVENEQVTKLRAIKSSRSAADVGRALDEVRRIAERRENVMPTLIDAVRARATVGEIMNALADVLGRYTTPVI
jgi:methylmalonyl-CoA mutase N-terminal domain/subunit